MSLNINYLLVDPVSVPSHWGIGLQHTNLGQGSGHSTHCQDCAQHNAPVWSVSAQSLGDTSTTMELPGQINPLEWLSLASHIPASSPSEGSSLSCHFFSSPSKDFQGLMGPRPDIDNLPDEFGEFFSLQSSSPVQVHLLCIVHGFTSINPTLWPGTQAPWIKEKDRQIAYWVLKPHW